MRLLPSLLAIGLALASPVALTPAHAVDTMTSADAPDLTSVRASIKAKDFAAAQAALKAMIDGGVQHADVYSLMGFTTRNLGDFKTALTYYGKALDFDPNHKGAHEYLGELYVKSGDMAKANEQLGVLVKLCPSGCEERDDLEKAIADAGKSAGQNG